MLSLLSILLVMYLVASILFTLIARSTTAPWDLSLLAGFGWPYLLVKDLISVILNK